MVKIFFDFETTGCYWNFDAPVQIAAICEKDGEIIDSFNELLLILLLFRFFLIY